MDSVEVDRLAQLLFEYQISSNKLEHCAAMLVFGSHDERVAHYAAKLYRQGWSSKIVFTGGLGRITKRLWHESGADRFARIAEQEQVPASAILRENKSRNTAENIRNTQKLLKQEGLEEKKLLVIERPIVHCVPASPSPASGRSLTLLSRLCLLPTRSMPTGMKADEHRFQSMSYLDIGRRHPT